MKGNRHKGTYGRSVTSTEEPMDEKNVKSVTGTKENIWTKCYRHIGTYGGNFAGTKERTIAQERWRHY